MTTIKRLLLPCSLTMLCLLTICLVFQWDKVVFITLIPIWFWFMIGVSMVALSWRFTHQRLACASAAVLWLISLVFWSDECRHAIRSVGRMLSPSKESGPLADATKFRVVTLNCRRTVEALKVASSLKPDIIFLQECPSQKEVEQFATDYFGPEGSAIKLEDIAILARGTFSDVETKDKDWGVLSVVLTTPEARTIALTNLHLHRAVIHAKYLSRHVLHHIVHIRKTNKYALVRLLSDHDSPLKTTHIIGGDFGTPPGDGIFRLLQDKGYQDAFENSGTGFGNTIKDKLPFWRIDQFWHSAKVSPLRTSTMRNPHSDHRMVIMDCLIH